MDKEYTQARAAFHTRKTNTWYFLLGSTEPLSEKPPKDVEYWEVRTNFEREDFFNRIYLRDQTAVATFIRQKGKLHEREPDEPKA